MNICYIIFLIFHYNRSLKITKKDFKIFLLEILLLCEIGTVIALVFNNFLLSPFINSLGNQNSSITYYNLTDVFIYFSINTAINGISFTLLVIFAIVLNEQFNELINTRSVNLLWIAVIGLSIGVIIELYEINVPSIILGILQNNYYLYGMIIGSLSSFIFILIPLMFTIILIINRKNSFFKLNLIYFLLFFALILIGQISFLLFFFPIELFQNPFIWQLIFGLLRNSFTLSINFMVLYFLINLIILKSPAEFLNEHSIHLKANFTFLTLFKKGKPIEQSKINIETSLEKIESILKENTES